MTAEVEVVARRPARHRVGRRGRRGRRDRLPPRRADRDPVLVRQPARLLRDNVLGTLNVAQAALRARRRARRAHLDERGLRHARRACRSSRTTRSSRSRRTPRARSRADKLMDSFHRSFELPVTVAAPVQHVRPAPVRAGDRPDDHQPGAGRDRRCASARCDPRRDFTFVEDTVAAFVAAAAADAAIGRTHPPRDRQRRVDRRARRARGRAARPRARGRDRPGARAAGQQRGGAPAGRPGARRASCSAGSRAVDLREGLARTIEWIERNVRRYRVGDYVI